MARIFALALSLLSCSIAGAEERVSWQKLENGLDFADIADADGSRDLFILRIDPEHYDFFLDSIGKKGEAPKTIAQWAEAGDYVATINASMYLPDGVTSTGYMKTGEYVNNPTISRRFGAFFVADPLSPGLPGAAIIDRDDPNWMSAIKQYGTVVQNYRMASSNGCILWNPGGPLYSISAVAQTRDGKLLFLHSRKPVEAHIFVKQILELPLNVGTIMYVEGGAQAGLAINTPRLKKVLAKPHAPSLLVTGNLNAVLPNIIGIRPKKR